MRFRLNTVHTEEDYIFFNLFQALKSPQNIKQIRNRYIFLCVMLLLVILLYQQTGWNLFSVAYAIFFGIYVLRWTLLHKRTLLRKIRSDIQKMKETATLPFDPVATLEFYEDRLVEITEARRIEEKYESISRVCVVNDQYIYMHYSSVGAYILLIPQLVQQANLEDFLNFISQKTVPVEYHKL